MYMYIGIRIKTLMFQIRERERERDKNRNGEDFERLTLNITINLFTPLSPHPTPRCRDFHNFDFRLPEGAFTCVSWPNGPSNTILNFMFQAPRLRLCL